MALHCLLDLPDNSPPHVALLAMQEVLPRVMLRDVYFVMQCVEKDSVEVQLTARYPIDKQNRMKLFQAIVFDRQTTNMAPIFRFIVVDMLHNAVQFPPNTKLAKDSLYPIRTEAVNMVLFIFSLRQKNESTVKRLADELIMSNFVDEEKKMTDLTCDQQMSSSSIILIKNLLEYKELFDEKTVKPARQLLENLCMKYTREWTNISALNGAEESAVIAANSNSNSNSASGSKSKQKTAVLQQPKKNKTISSVKRQNQGQKMIHNQLQKQIRASFTSKNLLAATTPRKGGAISALNGKTAKGPINKNVRSSLTIYRKENDGNL